jgi:hypothetical protein
MQRLGVVVVAALVLSACVSAEFPVSDPVYVPSVRNQAEPAVAFDGTNYLVVWADQRDGSDVYGARIRPDGSVLDITGIPIARVPGNQTDPDVAFDGTNFIVAWTSGGKSIVAARVSPAGVVLDPAGIPIVGGFVTVGAPALSVGNGNTLVVWAGCTASCNITPTSPVPYAIQGKRVAANGTVLDSAPIAIADAAGLEPPIAPDAAFDGANHLVVWDQIAGFSPTFDVVGRRVSGGGAVLGSTSFGIATTTTSEIAPNVAFDGANFLAVWTADPVSVVGRIRAARVTPAGVVLDVPGFDVSTALGSSPAVTFDATNSLVSWQDPVGGTLLARRVSPAGALVDPAAISISPGTEPALAAGSGIALVAFASGGPLPWVVKGSRLSGGTVLDHPPLALDTPANEQAGPSIASDGTGRLVAWSDARAGNDRDVYAARVLKDGTKLDGTGIAVSTASGSQFAPAVVFDGTTFFVVWADTRSGTSDIYGARVTTAGVVLDAGGIQITKTATTGENDPALAFDGTNYFVVWGTSPGAGVRGARVSTSGVVLDPAGIAVSASASALRPTIAFGGGNYFVAWEGSGGLTSDIFGARVATNGTVLDSAAITVSNAAGSQDVPAVAFDGTNHLVVWEDGRNSGFTDIYGARVAPAGSVLDPSGIAISTATDVQREPAVAANGDVLVVWRDDRRRGILANASDIYGARVTDAGTVRDPAGTGLIDTTALEHDPVVAPGNSAGRWTLAYSRFAPEQIYGAERVFHRSLVF